MQVIPAKIGVPRTPACLLRRPRLNRLLAEGSERPLTLIAAPAGFGKTVLVTSYFEQAEFSPCWYRLDEDDRGPDRFLTYLIASLAAQIPFVGRRSLPIIEQASSQAEIAAAVEALLSELASVPRCYVVLDDFHRVAGEEAILAIMARLLRYAPANLHFILTSRIVPEFDETADLLPDRLAVLDAGDLRFTAEESHQLLECLAEPERAPNVSVDIVERMAGWGAGLVVAAQALRGDGASGTVVTDEVFTYLATKVFRQQPAGVQDIMLAACITERFDTESIAWILGVTTPPDPAALLWSLGLFVDKVGDSPPTFAYHDLFRDFLREKLRAEQLRWQALHRRAASLEDARGGKERALAHLLDAGDWEAAAERILESASEEYRAGRYVSIVKAIDRLADDVIFESPALMRWRLRSSLILGRMEDARAFVGRAEARLGNVPEVIALWAYWHRAHGDRAAALKLANQAVDSLNEPSLLLGEAYNALYELLELDGESSLAIAAAKRGAEIYDALNEPADAVYLRMNSGASADRAGLLHEALGLLTEAEVYYERHPSPWRQALTLLNIGWIRYLLGEVTLAIEVTERAARLDGWNMYAGNRLQYWQNLGHYYRDLGQYNRAHECYAEAKKPDPTALIPEPPLRLGDNWRALLAGQSHAYRRERRFAEAQACLHESDRISGERAPYARGQRLLAEAALKLDMGRDPHEVITLCAAAIRDLGDTHYGASGLFIRAMARERVGDHAWIDDLRNALTACERTGGVAFLLAEAPRHVDVLLEAVERGVASPLLERVLEEGLEVPVRIRVRAFGEGSVEVNGSRVQRWPRSSGRELFFFLLLHGPATHAELEQELFPTAGPRQAASLLRLALHALRQTVHADVVVVEDGMYRLNDGLRITSDYWEFQRLLERIHRSDGSDWASLADAALALYRGRLLPMSSADWVAVRQRQVDRQIEMLLSLASPTAQLVALSA